LRDGIVHRVTRSAAKGRNSRQKRATYSGNFRPDTV
jgi:hypothetical protein